MVASITGVQSPINFLLNQVLTCYCRFYKSDLRQIFEGCASYIYVNIMPYRVEDSVIFFFFFFFSNGSTALVGPRLFAVS
jgi:hypothetical protein